MAITSFRRDILLDKEMVLLPFFILPRKGEQNDVDLFDFRRNIGGCLGNEYEIK